MHNVNRFMAVFDIAVSPCMTRYSRLATMWDVDVGCGCGMFLQRAAGCGVGIG